MKLKTERLVIRSLESSDAKELSRLANNPKIAKNLTDSFPSPYTLKEAKKWIKANPASKSKNYAITINNKLIGGIGLSVRGGDRKHVGEIGYWLGEEYWGKGFATEVLTALTEYYFQTFKLKRIEAKVYTWNPPSARLLEKAGYTLEGTLRNNSSKNGKVVDEWMYSIVR